MSAPDLEPCCYAPEGSHEVFCPIGSDRRVKAAIAEARAAGFKAGQERMRSRAAGVLPTRFAETVRDLPLEESER